MSKVLNFIFGFAIALVIAFIFGSLLLSFWMKSDVLAIMQSFEVNNLWGKALSIGSIPNILLFYLLLNKDNYMAARGVILSFVCIALLVFW